MGSGSTPQHAARLQSVVVGLIAGGLVTLAGVAILLPWFMPWTDVLALWTPILSFGVVFHAMLGPATAVRTNARRHSLGETAHECQCVHCERTFVAASAASPSSRSVLPPPKERLSATSAVLRGAVRAAVVIVLLLVAQVELTVRRNLGWESALIFHVLVALLIGGGFLIVALVALAMRRSDGRRVEEARRPHDCVCRWCGSTRQLDTPPVQS